MKRSQMYYSPIEWANYAGSGKWNYQGGTTFSIATGFLIKLAQYQDVSGGIAFGGPAMMLGGLFLMTIEPISGTTLLTVGGMAAPFSGMMTPDYLFSTTAHLSENAAMEAAVPQVNLSLARVAGF